MPTRDYTLASCDTTPGTCYVVWEELERERREKLEFARRERDRIIIENYREKQQKQQQQPEHSTGSAIINGTGTKRIINSESNPNIHRDSEILRPNTRSLANWPSSTRQQRPREALTSSPNFSLSGTVVSRKG